MDFRIRSKYFDPCWSFRLPESQIPLIAIINKKSGGRKGEKILTAFYKYLNPLQVIDITVEGIDLLRIFKSIPKFKILVGGGDGTVAWVLNYLYNSGNMTLPDGELPFAPLAILPLGTGNDLSRVLGWGKTCDPKDVFDIIKDVDAKSAYTLLDMWNAYFYAEVDDLGRKKSGGDYVHPLQEEKEGVISGNRKRKLISQVIY